ncbi:chemotaxis protein histidine kinase CheA [Rhizomicrobium palustre]|uniref:Chemotaxis protein histidine kinase CheA n=1 Tax=Rhizomicrobium palustre TaxID=189966 RepID=A0A846N2K3_9PROT|nr:Hpt domain-containing protein [Rhizomicrobium palustre]NIK89739.1 chemotaxis protein histidine kinase CheA [Rhizomicrobium palustre]
MNKPPKKAQIFMPPNTLRAKVGGGGYIDSDILARAEKAVDGLKAEFSDWLAADISALSAATVAFTAKPSPETADALFRTAHDLRGQATTFEYPLIARIAASLAKLMEGLGKTKTEVPPALISAHLDAIQVIYRDKVKDISNYVALALTEELERRVLKTLERARP